jgi:maltose-binding protein MalE
MTRISLGGAVLRATVSTALLVSLMSASAMGASVDLSKWSPDYVRSIAGTQDFDTAADCNKITPLDYKGRLTFWYQGVFEGDPDSLREYYKEFFATFRKTYPNIQLEEQGLTYNDLLDKFRTALLGNAAPMAVRLQILGGVEFASKGYLQPLKPEDIGYSTQDFWPGAMKAVTWDGVSYGIPTNNETMAFIWNADIFKRAGLDPEKRRQPGMMLSNIPSKSMISLMFPVTDWLPEKMPATRPIGSCRSFGHMAGASSTKPLLIRPTRRSSSPVLRARRPCKHPTTCMSATSQFPFRPLPTSRQIISRSSSLASSA